MKLVIINRKVRQRHFPFTQRGYEPRRARNATSAPFWKLRTETCKAVTTRHAECWAAPIEGPGHKLEEVLREEPPPSLRAAFRTRARISRRTISGGVPCERRAIRGSGRRARWRSKTSKDKVQAACLGIAREGKGPIREATQKSIEWFYWFKSYRAMRVPARTKARTGFKKDRLSISGRWSV